MHSPISRWPIGTVFEVVKNTTSLPSATSVGDRVILIEYRYNGIWPYHVITIERNEAMLYESEILQCLMVVDIRDEDG